MMGKKAELSHDGQYPSIIAGTKPFGKRQKSYRITRAQDTAVQNHIVQRQIVNKPRNAQGCPVLIFAVT